MFNKYELIGIGASIAVMAVALWLVRLDSVNSSFSALEQSRNEAGAIFVGQEGQKESIKDAVESASNFGTVNKLIVNDVVFGSGEPVESGDTVFVHYRGTLQNGQEFDNSYDRETPFAFTVGQGRVIKGWDEGLLGMKVGGKRILVIPSDLGYGKAGGGPIPPNSTLVFTIELLKIE